MSPHRIILIFAKACMISIVFEVANLDGKKQAQAIMLLAGESSLTKPVVAKSGDMIKTIPPQPQQISLPSICKPQGGKSVLS